MYTRTAADSPKAHAMHLQAEKTREEDQLSLALDLYEKAISLYEQDENYAGMAEAYLGKFLTYRHLYVLSKLEKDADTAYQSIYESEKLVKKYDIRPLYPVIEFEIGSWFGIQEEFEDAVIHFQSALDTHQGTDAEKGDYQYHLGFAQYKSGDKETGKRNLVEGLEAMRNNSAGADVFVLHVWESGALMSLADCLWEDSRDEAMSYLHEAEKIINSDELLVIRKRQITQLKAKLGIVKQ